MGNPFLSQGSYFGISAIFSGDIDYESSEFFDDEVNSGFVLNYGRQINESVAAEFSYVRYLDLITAEGLLKQDLTAIEASAVISPANSGGFVRLGYSNGESNTSSDTYNELNYDDDDSGLIYGLGFAFDTPNKGGAFRVEYTIGDYDNSEIKRLTLGTIVRC